MQNNDMQITVTESLDSVAVAVAGEVDILTAPALEEALRTAVSASAGRPLRLDLSGVTFFGSQGLHVLVTVQQLAESAGVTVSIGATSSIVRRLLDVADLAWMLEDGGRAGDWTP